MAVLGSLELLRKRLPAGDPKITRLLDNAVQGAERGAALTQRMLAFARRQELKPEAVEVPGLVAGMADLLRSSLGPAVEVAVDFPGALPPVRVDAHQLELALLNLAVNARDAMPSGGTLSVAARRETLRAGDETGPAGLGPGDYVRLTVADTGAGMDEETVKRATEPFFTTKGVGKGTGLGLSMVHGLAAQSGGAMRIASRPGAGTAVELWLPVTERVAVVVEAGLAVAGPLAQARPCAILLVDDDPLVLLGTASMLEDLGHSVLEASSGPIALEILRSGADVDLMVTDHSMPMMTGAELARAASMVRPGLPIILATGYADLPAGAGRGLPRLAKPFRQAELAARIADIVGHEEVEVAVARRA